MFFELLKNEKLACKKKSVRRLLNDRNLFIAATHDWAHEYIFYE